MFCVGYAGRNRRFLSVWRLDGEQATLRISVDGSGAKVLYPVDNRAVLKSDKEYLEVTLPERNSSVFMEL